MAHPGEEPVLQAITTPPNCVWGTSTGEFGFGDDSHEMRSCFPTSALA